MKKLVTVADVITPNLTECCILCDVDYCEFIKNADKPDFMDKIAELGKNLLNRYGVKIVIITGIEHKSADGTVNVQNLIASEDEIFTVSCKKIGGSYSGTGDLFASVMFSGLLRGDTLRDTVSLAVKFIETSLRDTVNLGIDRNEGIEFEKHLNLLL